MSLPLTFPNLHSCPRKHQPQPGLGVCLTIDDSSHLSLARPCLLLLSVRQVAVLWTSPGHLQPHQASSPTSRPHRFSLTVESPPAEAQELHDFARGSCHPVNQCQGPAHQVVAAEQSSRDKMPGRLQWPARPLLPSMTVPSMHGPSSFCAFVSAAPLAGRPSPLHPLHLSLKNLSDAQLLSFSVPARCWCEPSLLHKSLRLITICFSPTSVKALRVKATSLLPRVPRGIWQKYQAHTEEGIHTGNHMYLMHYFMLKEGWLEIVC